MFNQYGKLAGELHERPYYLLNLHSSRSALLTVDWLLAIYINYFSALSKSIDTELMQ